MVASRRRPENAQERVDGQRCPQLAGDDREPERVAFGVRLLDQATRRPREGLFDVGHAIVEERHHPRLAGEVRPPEQLLHEPDVRLLPELGDGADQPGGRDPGEVGAGSPREGAGAHDSHSSKGRTNSGGRSAAVVGGPAGLHGGRGRGMADWESTRRPLLRAGGPARAFGGRRSCRRRAGRSRSSPSNTRRCRRPVRTCGTGPRRSGRRLDAA